MGIGNDTPEVRRRNPLGLDTQRLLLDSSHTRRYAPGAVIVAEGEAPTSLFWLIRGQAAVRLSNWRGHEVILSYVNEGEFFGEMGLFPGVSERTAMVRATRECMVLELSYVRFRTLAARHDQLWLALLGQLARHLRETNRQLVDTGLLRVPKRILQALNSLALESPADAAEGGSRLRVTREDLGNLVGCTREVAGRALKQLASEGHLRLDGRAIVIRRAASAA